MELKPPQLTSIIKTPFSKTFHACYVMRYYYVKARCRKLGKEVTASFPSKAFILFLKKVMLSPSPFRSRRRYRPMEPDECGRKY